MTHADLANLTPRSFIFSYLSHYKRPLVIGFVFVTLTNLTQVIAPLVLKYGIEVLEAHVTGKAHASTPLWLSHWTDSVSMHHVLIIMGLVLVAVAAVNGLFRYFMRNILIGASRDIEYDLRNDYLAHLQTLSATFFQKYKTGDLMARATNDMEAVRTMFGPGIMYMMNTITVGLFALILMLSLSPVVTLASLLPMPFVALIVRKQVGKISKMFQNIQAQYSSITAKVQENISGIRVIKSYVQEPHEITEFARMNQEYISRNMKLVRVRATLWSTIEFLLGLTTLVTLMIGGWQVISHRLTLGSLVAFLAYLAMLAWPIIALGWVLNLWQEGMGSAERILNILKEKPEIRDGAETDPALTEIKGEIEFHDLCFSYPGATAPVLKNINLHISSGTTLAIVGHTGSGKSTWMHLIPRLYDAPAGTLLIDGHDVRRIPLADLRRQIGFVTQETFLFSDLLRANLAFGVDGTSETELQAAVETAQLNKDLDQFPQGWQTMVGERGLTLSGGQKQRVAIARAVLRNPRILILDDALSAVDTYTEEEILSRLRTVREGRTTLIVSHRISTVRDADWIVVLKNGEIAEQGRHEELLAQGGLYHTLYERQLLEQSLEEI
jgi:ATP-binding cassette, subfamily B, multidrug efflux pump